MDTETEAEIRQALNALMENRTSFVIAHRIQSVMEADLILVMDKGEIVQSGLHADLLAQEGIYRQIYDIQTRIESELEKEIDQSKLSGDNGAAPEIDEAQSTQANPGKTPLKGQS